MSRYVAVVEAINIWLGRIVMYGIFVLIAILLWSSVSKAFFVPSLWTLEMAQFALVTYYILGGPYCLQRGSDVRMDLLYSTWTDRQRAWVDSFTVLFLIFFLGFCAGCFVYYQLSKLGVPGFDRRPIGQGG